MNRVTNIGLLLLLAMTPTHCVFAQGNTQGAFRSPASSAYVRTSDGAYVTHNKIFEFADVFRDHGDGYIRLLLLKTIRNEHVDGREETTGRVRVQAWTVANDGTRKQRWQFEAAGNDGEALHEDRFFRVTQWGCCDWPHVNTYFSLLSGRKLYVSNSNLLSVSASQGGPTMARYVAFGYFAHGEPPLLQYGSDTKVVQRFVLLSPREYYDAPKLFLIMAGKTADSLVLKPPFTFTILLKYADGLEIRVPVQNDAIQPPSNLPQGYSLQTADER